MIRIAEPHSWLSLAKETQLISVFVLRVLRWLGSGRGWKYVWEASPLKKKRLQWILPSSAVTISKAIFSFSFERFKVLPQMKLLNDNRCLKHHQIQTRVPRQYFWGHIWVKAVYWAVFWGPPVIEWGQPDWGGVRLGFGTGASVLELSSREHGDWDRPPYLRFSWKERGQAFVITTWTASAWRQT